MKSRFIASIALVVAGCASHPAPTEQMATSIAAVRGAEEAGAMQVPEAALHVKLAQEQIERAKEMVEHDENQRAEDLAIRAANDAELAIAIAREDAAKRRLQEFAQNSQTSGGEQTAPASPAMQPAAGRTVTP